MDVQGLHSWHIVWSIVTFDAFHKSNFIFAHYSGKKLVNDYVNNKVNYHFILYILLNLNELNDVLKHVKKICIPYKASTYLYPTTKHIYSLHTACLQLANINHTLHNVSL